MVVEDFPWTLALSLIGLIIGLILPSGLEFFPILDVSNVSLENAGDTITGYVIGGGLAIGVSIISGLICMFFMGIIGFFVDFLRGIS